MKVLFPMGTDTSSSSSVQRWVLDRAMADRSGADSWLLVARTLRRNRSNNSASSSDPVVEDDTKEFDIDLAPYRVHCVNMNVDSAVATLQKLYMDYQNEPKLWLEIADLVKAAQSHVVDLNDRDRLKKEIFGKLLPNLQEIILLELAHKCEDSHEKCKLYLFLYRLFPTNLDTYGLQLAHLLIQLLSKTTDGLFDSPYLYLLVCDVSPSMLRGRWSSEAELTTEVSLQMIGYAFQLTLSHALNDNDTARNNANAMRIVGAAGFHGNKLEAKVSAYIKDPWQGLYRLVALIADKFDSKLLRNLMDISVDTIGPTLDTIQKRSSSSKHADRSSSAASLPWSEESALTLWLLFGWLACRFERRIRSLWLHDDVGHRRPAFRSRPRSPLDDADECTAAGLVLVPQNLAAVGRDHAFFASAQPASHVPVKKRKFDVSGAEMKLPLCLSRAPAATDKDATLTAAAQELLSMGVLCLTIAANQSSFSKRLSTNAVLFPFLGSFTVDCLMYGGKFSEAIDQLGCLLSTLKDKTEPDVKRDRLCLLQSAGCYLGLKKFSSAAAVALTALKHLKLVTNNSEGDSKKRDGNQLCSTVGAHIGMAATDDAFEYSARVISYCLERRVAKATLPRDSTTDTMLACLLVLSQLNWTGSGKKLFTQVVDHVSRLGALTFSGLVEYLVNMELLEEISYLSVTRQDLQLRIVGPADGRKTQRSLKDELKEGLVGQLTPKYRSADKAVVKFLCRNAAVILESLSE